MKREKAHSSHIGPVIVVKGEHKGRIGHCDDVGDIKYYDIESGHEIDCLDITDEEIENIEESKEVFIEYEGAIYFGDMLMAFNTLEYIPFKHLELPTLKDLFNRFSKLTEDVSGLKLLHEDYNPYKIIELLYERDYVLNLLNNAILEGRDKKVKDGKKIFISHSKKDAYFARMLNDELVRRGHQPWFDENNIKVGDSIPAKINNGIRESNFVVVVLTENAVNSKWVEVEWTSKYWEEVEKSKVSVLPVLLEGCVVPQLLKFKKYANFSNSYNDGLFELFSAIEG